MTRTFRRMLCIAPTSLQAELRLGRQRHQLYPMLIVGLSCQFAAGCASLPESGDPALLQFLDGSAVTRDQVVGRLGTPFSEFELDRIVIYGLSRDRAGYFIGWPDSLVSRGRFHVVIEFDERDMLRQYAVVDVEAGVTP